MFRSNCLVPLQHQPVFACSITPCVVQPIGSVEYAVEAKYYEHYYSTGIRSTVETCSQQWCVVVRVRSSIVPSMSVWYMCSEPRARSEVCEIYL